MLNAVKHLYYASNLITLEVKMLHCVQHDELNKQKESDYGATVNVRVTEL